MDMHDFVSGGGLYKTTAGYDANVTTILVKSGNTYPLVGYVNFTSSYSANVSWDANGIVVFAGANNAGLNLVPVFTITNYSVGDANTLSSYSTVSSWNSAYNIIYHDRNISY